jgi:hypothetical protein
MDAVAAFRSCFSKLGPVPDVDSGEFMALGEHIGLDGFRVGGLYSRMDIAAVGAVRAPAGSRDPHWDRGLIEFDNAILLMVTLDKAETPDYPYEDRFDGSIFLWQSQNKQTQASRQIRRISSGDISVCLFARVKQKRKGRTVPFVYCGRLASPAMEGNSPVTALFESADFATSPSADLKEVYEWRPERPPTPEEAERERKLNSRRGTSRGGQGRELDPVVRSAVEHFAMRVAREHYSSLGYEVEDTHVNRPYDYVARKGSETRRVEVKGSQGDASSVTVTAGEVRAATRGPEPTDLFVVFAIEITKGPQGVVASSGRTRIITDWAPAASDLEPTEYRYRLPQGATANQAG